MRSSFLKPRAALCMTPNLTGRLGVPGPRGDVWERDLTHLTENESRHVGELGGGGWGRKPSPLSPCYPALSVMVEHNKTIVTPLFWCVREGVSAIAFHPHESLIE